MEDADDAVAITVMLTKTTVEKLQELTGSDSNFSEYLTMIIQREYSERPVLGTQEIEQVVSLAEHLAKQNKNYHLEISTLREQYNRLAVSQEDLLATVEQLRNTTTEMLKNTKKGNLH